MLNLFSGVSFILSLLAVCLISGCANRGQKPYFSDVPGASSSASSGQPQSVFQDPAFTESAPPPQPAAKPTATAVASPAKPQPAPEPIVTPDATLSGKVVSVNEAGRFVVLRFPLGRMPDTGATLFVYRQGLRVAELRVSGPQKDDHTVADIVTGECRNADDVRDR
jgi:hypothetical protein